MRTKRIREFLFIIRKFVGSHKNSQFALLYMLIDPEKVGISFIKIFAVQFIVLGIIVFLLETL